MASGLQAHSPDEYLNTSLLVANNHQQARAERHVLVSDISTSTKQIIKAALSYVFSK